MASYGFTVVILVALSTLEVQQVTARQIREASDSSTIKSLVNLSLEELVFILKTRNGEAAENPKRLTPCARAILSCCSEKKINEYCSESLKCGAYFFDDNPCEDKFLTDALKNAKYFYEQFSSSNKVTDKRSS